MYPTTGIHHFARENAWSAVAARSSGIHLPVASVDRSRDTPTGGPKLVEGAPHGASRVCAIVTRDNGESRSVNLDETLALPTWTHRSRGVVRGYRSVRARRSLS